MAQMPEFTDDLNVKHVVVTDLTYDSIHTAAGAEEFQQAVRQARETGGIKSVAMLKQRVFELVYVNSLKTRATSLGEVNRLYIRAANKLGVTLVDVVSSLVDAGLVEALNAGTHYGYFTKSLADVMRELNADVPAFDFASRAISNMRATAQLSGEQL